MYTIKKYLFKFYDGNTKISWSRLIVIFIMYTIGVAFFLTVLNMSFLLPKKADLGLSMLLGAVLTILNYPEAGHSELDSDQ